MLTRTYQTRYGDFKSADTIREETVLDIIQDIATRDSESLGYGIKELSAMNIAWLLQGINLRFDRPISTRYDIDVFTAVKTMGGATSERGCILKQNGVTVARSLANWFTFDTSKMKLCRIPAEMSKSYACHDFGDELFDYEKLRPIECTNIWGKMTVSISDLDTNHHLNNRKGAIMLMNALPVDFEYNKVNLVYKKSAYLGDELTVCTAPTAHGLYVQLQTDDGRICVAGLFEYIK